MSETIEYYDPSKTISKDMAETPMNMLSSFLQDLVSYYYGVTGLETSWGATDTDDPCFQFVFDLNDGNQDRFNNFLEDVKTTPSVANRSYDPDHNIVIVSALDEMITFLEDLSAHKSWGLHMPLNEYMGETSKEIKEKASFEKISDLPPGSVFLLKRPFYDNFQQVKDDLATVFDAAGKDVPNPQFTYSLQQIIDAHDALIAQNTDEPRFVPPVNSLHVN